MGNIFRILRNLFGNKKASTNEEQTPEIIISESIEEMPITKKIDWNSLVSNIIENGYVLNHFDIADIRIVVGNKTLTIIYDRRELGLHSFGIYDYCTTSDEEGHKLMAQIIRENEDEAYKSLIIESSKDELWINIADCTNRGVGSYSRVYNQMIEVFEPLLLRFIKDNAVSNNVGLCMSYGDDFSQTTSFLCQKLKTLGFNIHTAIIESNWDTRLKAEFEPSYAQLKETSCTHRIFQFPMVDNMYNHEIIDECSRKTLLESISYLKTVISE